MGPLLLLERIQDLLRDSRYTTTYKFAVLHALCDLSLELAPGERRLALDRLAERTIELYWQQVVPFHPPGSRASIALRMATGGRAAAVTLVDRMHAKHDGRLSGARRSGRMRDYTKSMLAVLRKDVLKRLQPAGIEPFLYRVPVSGDELELLPGVPETLRRFSGLLTDMIEARWTAWVEQRNPEVAGSDMLRRHLFAPNREVLRAVVPMMLDLQTATCFYSGARLTARTAEVDHFLPWSLTHNNSVGNLVLATKTANLKKRDSLPTAAHKRKWESRNSHHAAALAQLAGETGLPWQPDGLAQLADWLYRRSA